MRVFTGLPLPPELSRDIAGWVQSWGPRSAGLRLVEADKMHITMRFFGELATRDVDDLSSALSGLKSDRITAVVGLGGCFPSSKNPRVYYLGMGEGAERLVSLYHASNALIEPLGCESERRPYVPHITLARVKRGRSSDLRLDRTPLTGRTLTLERFVLYESRLSPTGARHVPLLEIPFVDLRSCRCERR